MTCERCGHNTATTILTTTVNNTTTKEHICSSCAAQDGLQSLFSQFPLTAMMAGMVKSTAANHKRCESCGTGFEEIAESGRIGCSHCYDTFRSELIPLIEKIHGKASHVGKKPSGWTKSNPSERLKEQLQSAIAIQDFETAAKLRDEIKSMEAEEKSDGEEGCEA